MQEIELSQILFIIRKWVWKIVLVSLVFSALAGIIGYFIIPPTYRATTTLMMSKQNPNEKLDYSDTVIYQMLGSTYGEILKSRSIFTKVKDNLNLDTDYEDFIETVDVYVIKGTQIIEIEFRDNDPNQAAKIANEMASVFINSKSNDQWKDMYIIRILDYAQINMKPDLPKPLVIVLVTCILTIFIFCTGLIVYEVLNLTIHSSDDLKKQIGVMVLGVLPNVSLKKKWLKKSNGNIKKESAIEYVQDSIYNESLRVLRTKILYLCEKKNFKLLLITSPDKGSGSSTIACNLARATACLNKKVLIVDASLRKTNACRNNLVFNEKGLTDILNHQCTLAEAIQSSPYANMDIIYSGTPVLNFSELLSSSKMSLMIQALKKYYDLVIIDTPSLESSADASILSTTVDGIILVFTEGKTRIHNAQKTITLLNHLNAEILGVVINEVP